MTWARIAILLAILVLPAAAPAEYASLDELAKAYSVDKCRGCHKGIHAEWERSYHSQSIVHSLGGIRNFITVGLSKEWNTPVSRAHLMRCMDCHAPMLKDASEAVAKQVADLIVTAAEGKDEKRKSEALKELGKLTVNCIVCHNTKAAVDKNFRGDPQPGVYYGPTGNRSPAHKTERSEAMGRALFCGQCHGVHTPPDGDIIVCNTLYGSYQEAYRGGGGAETCQDCHMKKDKRGHTFPGAYDAAMVKEGIGIDVQATGFKITPGKWVPAAAVTVSLINQAGHRIPDG